MLEFLYNHLYLLKILGILLLTFGLTIVEKTVFHRIYPKVKASPRIWDDALVYALHFPLKLYMWLSGLTFSIAVAEQAFTQDHYVFSFIESVHKIGAFVLFIWTLARFINEFEEQFSKVRRGKHDPTTLRGITQVLKVTLFTFGGLGMLQFFGIPLSGVIAFGGIGGIAVGFAAKDLLANYFGGLMIFIDRPFKIGDWIRSPDQQIEGTVETIGWRLTRIRTFDRRPLFVPNSVFSTISLENPSRMTNRRIRQQFHLRYEDFAKIEDLTADIRKMLNSHPEIDTNRPLYVHVINFTACSVEVEIYTFTKITDWIKFQGIQEKILVQILKIIDAHGCKIAYPVSEIEFNRPAEKSMFIEEGEAARDALNHAPTLSPKKSSTTKQS